MLFANNDLPAWSACHALHADAQVCRYMIMQHLLTFTQQHLILVVAAATVHAEDVIHGIGIRCIIHELFWWEGFILHHLLAFNGM